MELDVTTAVKAMGGSWFNLLRRGADGSLALSADRWRVDRLESDALYFAAEADEAAPLTLALRDVERAWWDRLPKQQVRSQVRFRLRSGDLWTFSGSVDPAALPAAP